MPSFVLRATVAAAPDAVFAALATPANAALLFSGTSPDAPLEPGPVRAGSRFRRRRTVGSQTFDGEVVVDVYRPGKEYAVRAEARGIRVESRWRLTLAADGAATGVAYECSVQGSGLASFVEGPVTDALRRADADHLQRLAAVLGATIS